MQTAGGRDDDSWPSRLSAVGAALDQPWTGLFSL